MGQQICYRIFSEILELPEIGRYRTYGLSACPRQQPNGETQNQEFVRVTDVSTREEKVRRLAERFETGDLAPVHLRDVLLDLL